MTDELLSLSAVELAQKIRSKHLCAREVIEAHLQRIEAVEPKIRAFLTLTRKEALQQATLVDEGKRTGPLAGIPIAVKDVLCTKGIRTTCGSRILEHFVPPYDATVVERLHAAGAICVGKTNMDEFAMGSSTEHSAFFPTRNPWDLERSPGGSSGGSAAAVAAGESTLSLGSDTGGSIRQPAALTGTVGFKPTYGRVSRYGLVAFASSLDQIGPFARSVSDAALLMSAIAGKDPRDSTSADLPVPDFMGRIEKPLSGIRLGVPKEYFAEGLEPEVRRCVEEALRAAERAGAQRVEVSLPRSKYGIACYYVVTSSEASSNLARYDGVHYGLRAAQVEDVLSLYSKTRRLGFGSEVTRRILLGTFALSSGYYDAYYNHALKVRRLIKEDFDRAFEKADVIVGPTSPCVAFRLGAKAQDPLAMYLCDIYTVTAPLAGLPGISIPCGFSSEGLPIGLHIQGRAFDDLGVLQAARSFERELSLNIRIPELG